MTFDEVRAKVRAAREASPSFRECAEALDVAAFEELGPGRTTAREALATFSTRREIAASGGMMRSTLTRRHE